MTQELVMMAVGDIAPDREEPGSIFAKVSGLLNSSDLVFGQLEAVLSERGTHLPQARLVCSSTPKTAQAMKEAGFDIISFASNHCMDLGREAFLDTIEVLRQQELAVIGVGANIDEARKPAIIDCRGTKIAFLAYNTILPQGYWAAADRPGCVPLRALTLYEQIEHDQPGTPCRTHTYPQRDDLRAMIKDIKEAKAQADLVVVSMHWGIHFIRAVLADYQKDMAYAAINAGADLILGHHAHILKGIEVYKGKAIFYSLSNFALDLPVSKAINSSGHKDISKLDPEWQPDPEYPNFFMPRDARKTLIVKCVISNKKIRTVSFLPAYINGGSQPEVLNSRDPRFDEVLNYISDISMDQGLDTEFTVDGEEVMVLRSGGGLHE